MRGAKAWDLGCCSQRKRACKVAGIADFDGNLMFQFVSICKVRGNADAAALAATFAVDAAVAAAVRCCGYYCGCHCCCNCCCCMSCS